MTRSFVPLFALACVSAPAKPPTPRSFLVIVADDVGTDKVGAYGEVPNAPATPNIDGLAAEGVLFRNAYVTPVCSSSRALLLTGRYGRRTGMGGIIDEDAPYELPLAEVTIPEALDRGKRNWTSAALGKWHLSGASTEHGYAHPQLQGFDRARGSLANVRNTVELDQGSYFRWEKNVDGRLEVTSQYATRDTTEEAIDALRDLKPPFFLWVAYNSAHEPFHWPRQENRTRGREVEMEEAQVEDLDQEIGRLLRALSPEQRENTTIVFVGDNGTPGDVTRAPRDPERGKGTLYEGGTNVPFIVAGAGVTGRGESAGLVDGADLLPTVLELAGVSADGLTLDGVSVAPLLIDPSAPSARKYVYTERFRPNGPPPYKVDEYAIRDDRYKVVQLAGGALQRFDLEGRSDDGPPLGKNTAPERFEALEAELTRLRATLTYGTGADR